MPISPHQKRIAEIVIGLGLFLFALLLEAENTARLLLFLAAYAVAGGDVILRAARNISRRQIFDENFLMSVATIGAFCIGQYSEAVAVMLFYKIGMLFQDRAVDKSRRSIAELMNIRPDYANIKIGNVIDRVDPDEVNIGDVIVIKPGEKVPLDCVVMEGSSSLDTSPLTGESMPKAVREGDELLSGSVNLNGLLVARVKKVFSESTASKILDLVENASAKKSKHENFITKFARFYTPAVVGGAAFIAVVPPLALGGAAFGDWIYRALVFLVISCPCALVISIPLSFFGGLGAAARKGILVKGSNYLEALADAEVAVFDKTGTLTKGTFKVQEVVSQDMYNNEEILKFAACAESFSNHPISLSIRRAYGKEVDAALISNVKEIPGQGVTATVDGRFVAAGNAKMMQMLDISISAEDLVDAATVVHVAVDGEYKGYIVIGDAIKEDATKAVSELKAQKVKKVVMLTGDAKSVAESVASHLGIDEAYGGLLPADKVQKVEDLMAGKSAKGKLIFVGDGINDAPVLARADVGIAMGGLGSDAAIEAADVVIMTDEPSKVPVAIKIAKRTLGIARQNIAIALGVKGAVLALGALGIATMWAAVFADVGVTLIAVFNAIRVLGSRL
ncbi:heavy metal translocating P-type ATPase [Acetomicrobium hydrogeniformans]|uniref:Cadmium-exporting ATPase n=1 Tax=Acetomicrobium hydrogeniformans ATCC BAA-1850 TaxID=592015 RepID=A0A0T5X873_9BACT|nr:heavy metal translocating P-type ATPase [Acetomicrobium hydrogeniformans]KRT34340.1 cadmium-exporting ATPase [Acetomicrobium hydrogeniformans ATCC BAA-1850]